MCGHSNAWVFSSPPHSSAHSFLSWKKNDDANASALSHHFRGIVLHWPACRIKPASRHLYSDRNRNDAGGGQSEFHCVLAFQPDSQPTTHRCDRRDFFHRYRGRRSSHWSRTRDRSLSSLSNQQCRSTQSAQRI